MKILIVEDDKCRIEWFQMVMKGHELIVVGTEQEAITMLSMHRFDEIWLDHDLGVNAGDGMGIAKTLASLVIEDRYPNNAVIQIHSCNTPAAINMKKYLDLAFKNVIINPFLWLISNRDEMMAEYKESLNG